MVTISPLTPILPVGSATSQSGGRNHGGSFASPGQFLKGIVLEVRGEGRFLLDIAGNQITAESKAALSAGQSLRLQVIQTAPQIELKIVSGTVDQFFGRSLTLLGKNIDLTGLFQAFNQQPPSALSSLPTSTRNVIENFFLSQQNTFSGSDGGAVLKQLVDRLGLSLENILARGDTASASLTLKAALLDLAHIFQNAQNISDAASKILTTIELFQLAQLQTSSDRQFIFPLPLPFVEQGYLLIDRDSDAQSGKDNGPQNRRFSLHINMTELGNIQIDFLSIEETLYIHFRTDSQEKVEFVEQFSEQLKEAISDIPQINLSFSADAPDPLTDLMRLIVPEGNSMLDTKA